MKRKFISVLLLIVLFTSTVFSAGCEIISGKSAYDIAVEHGFSGTEEEWLESLKADPNTSVSGSNGGNIIINNNGANKAAYAANKGLLSAVSIYSVFTTRSNGWFSQSSTYYSAGSGVIYKLDKDKGSAYIITNYHVVYEADSNTSNHISDEITVYLYGMEYQQYAIEAQYIGGSMTYDIAVLYVENSDILKTSIAEAIDIADSDEIAVGQDVIAVGNPEAMGISASLGIVSIDSEYITMTAVDNVTSIQLRVIRIDAAVNSGNSGGGLFDAEGNLIGIVNAKISSDDIENIGYAIPSNIAIAIADNIIYYCDGSSNESVQRAIVGVSIQTEASKAVLDEQTGFVKIVETVSVASVNSGSLSDGVFQVGDILKTITVGDTTKEVTRRHTVIDMMLAARIGDTITFSIERNGTPMTVSITITQDCLTAY